MLRPSILFFIIGISAMAHVCGQSVSGHVQTFDHKPLPFVSVALLRDASFMTGGITNENGNFKLQVPLISGVQYKLKLSLIGYQTLEQPFTWPDTASLTKLVLVRSEKLLGEVIVASGKPLVTRRADRYIVQVEDSYLANGHSGLEVLQRSPGLWVSPDGSIRIIGGQSVTVMINDVVQRMSSAELADFLRSLRSEDIAKIEVIPNPPSEYEASSTGGIVHIILKKSRKDGLTGNLSGQYRQQGSNPAKTLGSSFDYKSQQLYLVGGYNFSNDKTAYTGWNNVQYPDKSSLYNTTSRNNNITRHQFRAGLLYDFSPRHSLNIQAMGMSSRLVNRFESGLDYNLPAGKVTGNAQSGWRRKPWQGSYTLNYGWKLDTIGSVLRMIADYTTSSKSEINELLSVYSDTARNQYYHTITPSTTHLTSLQADYTKALRNTTVIKAGIKYVHTSRNNTVLTERYKDQEWQKDNAASNEFEYKEDLLMFYASLEKTIRKTSIKAGLRGENTWANGYSITIQQSINRNYFGWFPSLFITQDLNEKKGNVLVLNYARRVRRPGYNDLNPYRLQVHDFTVMTGNPNLVPQYTHSLRAGYTYRHNYTATAYLQSTSNYLAQTASTIDSNIVEYRTKNYPNNTEYGLSLEAVVNFTKTWNSRTSLIAYYISSKMDVGRFSGKSLSVQSIQNITWKKVMDIDMVIQYNSPYLQANSRYAQIFSMDAGFTRKLFKDRFRLRLYASDIFNTVREKELTIYGDTRIDFYQKRPTRTFGLALNYNFRAGRVFTKKRIDQHTSDEKSRL
jgi:outer membrane receptor protein involved in Fe transport